MITECIVLAGGLGTRLRSTLPGLPKVLAPVAGQPFLSQVFKWLEKNNITHVTLSLGYRSEEVIGWCKTYTGPLKLSYSIENEPLGTGGAIALAIQKAKSNEVFVANGDTLFDVNLDAMQGFHKNHESDITLALKPLEHFDRYGVVNINKNERITGFEEKRPHEKGLINGGVYLLNKFSFERVSLPQKFSFEQDFLEAYFNQLNMYGFIQNSYFIDIGVPEDYQRAQTEMK